MHITHRIDMPHKSLATSSGLRIFDNLLWLAAVCFGSQLPKSGPLKEVQMAVLGRFHGCVFQVGQLLPNRRTLFTYLFTDKV